MFNYRLFRTSSTQANNFYDLIRSGDFDKEKFKEDYLLFNSHFKISEKMVEGLDFILTYPQIIDDIIELKNIISKYNFSFYDILKYYTNEKLYYNPIDLHLSNDRRKLHQESLNEEYNTAQNILRDYSNKLKILDTMGEKNEISLWGKLYTKQEVIDDLDELKQKVEFAKKVIENHKKSLKELEESTISNKYGYPISETENSAIRCRELIKKILNIVGMPNVKMVQYLLKEIFFLKPLFVKLAPKLKSPKLREVPSKYFSEFNLTNSTQSEKKIFESFEKLGLHAIPATQDQTLKMTDSEGNPYGFRIDFLLPCNVRVYDDRGNYSLREDIIFVGEYFGFYGPTYEAKTEKKIELQNMIESSLDQRCLHIKDIRNLCPVLEEKNIDCKCFPDYKKQLFDIESDLEKKKYFVKSQLQHFLYSSLINELMWQIRYDHSQSTIENYEKIKEKNIKYIEKFENLINEVENLSPIEIRKKCSNILLDYKNKFQNEKWRGQRLFRKSARYKITIK